MYAQCAAVIINFNVLLKVFISFYFYSCYRIGTGIYINIATNIYGMKLPNLPGLANNISIAFDSFSKNFTA